MIGSVRSLIEDYLRQGSAVEIDGIGSLELDAGGKLIFKRNGKARVFLAYAHEDRGEVKRLYKGLQLAGFEPWMDSENLLPGQNWPRAIERAIETSDYFLGCFSSDSISKRGHFQAELAYALDVARTIPAQQAFFVPVRLDECALPEQVAQQVHYLDLYPDWKHGVEILARALNSYERAKKRGPA